LPFEAHSRQRQGRATLPTWATDPDQPDEMHRRSIRGFLSMIDPGTGYIAED
jgi:hypothetical protein